jgi:hypothetical protein
MFAKEALLTLLIHQLVFQQEEVHPPVLEEIPEPQPQAVAAQQLAQLVVVILEEALQSQVPP